MNVKIFVLGELQANAYLVYSADSQRSVLIDPGGQPDSVIAYLKEKELQLDAILLTHGHVDHCGGVVAIKREFNVPLHLHRGDFPVLASSINSELARTFMITVPESADVELSEGDNIPVGDLTLTVLHTPGHSPGSVCFSGPGMLFSGDTLFQSSIGRTDLPGGDFSEIQKSLQRIVGLPGDTIVYPGHGDTTNLEEEKLYNPFL